MRKLIIYCLHLVKEVPLFLIAHSNLAKSNGNFILCTKKPAFLTKLVQFNSTEELNLYLESTTKEYQIIPNRTEILEIVSFFDNPQIDQKTFKRMAHWYAHYGEKEA